MEDKVLIDYIRYDLGYNYSSDEMVIDKFLPFFREDKYYVKFSFVQNNIIMSSNSITFDKDKFEEYKINRLRLEKINILMEKNEKDDVLESSVLTERMTSEDASIIAKHIKKIKLKERKLKN